MYGRIALPVLILASAGWVRAAETFYDNYAAGLKALQAGDCPSALVSFERAVVLDDKEAARRRTYGMNVIEYYPHLQIARVAVCLGDSQRALAELDLSERQGVSKGDEIAKLRSEILKRSPSAVPTAAVPGGQGIAVFKTKEIAPYLQVVDAFKAQCKESCTLYDVSGDAEKDGQLTQHIRAVKPKLVMAIGEHAALFVRDAFPDLPSIYCMVKNPEADGLIRPNMTGVRLQVAYSEQFLMLKTLLPNLKSVGVLYDPARTEDRVAAAVEDARKVGLEVVLAEVNGVKDVPKKLRELLARKVGIVWLTTDETVLQRETFKFIARTTLENGTPIVTNDVALAQEGPLLVVAPSVESIGTQAGQIANRLLGGGKVSDIPLQASERTTLALNLKIAQALGVAVPKAIVDAADVVIQP